MRCGSATGLARGCGAWRLAVGRTPPAHRRRLRTCNQPSARSERFWGLSDADMMWHHPASPWRYNLVEAARVRTADPDQPLSEWLRDGVPMGLAEPIPEGGLFPTVDDTPEISLEDLEREARCSKNHPSFDILHGLTAPPGVGLIE